MILNVAFRLITLQLILIMEAGSRRSSFRQSLRKKQVETALWERRCGLLYL